VRARSFSYTSQSRGTILLEERWHWRVRLEISVLEGEVTAVEEAMRGRALQGVGAELRSSLEPQGRTFHREHETMARATNIARWTSLQSGSIG
jgi:hypothetical protein